MLKQVFACLATSTLFCLLFVACTDNKSTQQENLFYYYELSQRLKSLETIESAIESKYALIDIKKHRLGVDIKDVFSEARSIEKDFPNKKEVFFRAVSNLWFFDRVRKTVAKFQDTHLQVRPLMDLPSISLGLNIVEVEGQFIVSSIDSRLEDLFWERGVDLSIGDQVYTLDGVSLKKQQKDLEKYISSSSDVYRKKLATEALTQRDFRYPKSPKIEITYRNRDGKVVSTYIKWTYDYSFQRTDALFYLQHRGFDYRSSEDLVLFGYSDKNPPNYLSDVREWHGSDDSSQLTLRTGIVSMDGSNYGLIQLFSFYETTVLDLDSGESFLWDQPIIEFLKILERRRIPLILDLRFNQGGHVDAPLRLMSLLAKPGESYPSYMEGFRVTRNIQQIWQRVFPGQEYDSFEDSKAAKQIRRALSSGQRYTGMWPKTQEIRSSDETGGFSLPIVTLISENCISACDIFALLIESSNRSTMLGRPSNGTGSGFFDWAPYSGSSWVDMEEIFEFEIPNMLFGHGLEQGPEEYFTERATLLFNRENRPVYPHKFYKTKKADILNDHEGWLKAAVELF